MKQVTPDSASVRPITDDEGTIGPESVPTPKEGECLSLDANLVVIFWAVALKWLY
jgi:hypothetical protein